MVSFPSIFPKPSPEWSHSQAYSLSRHLIGLTRKKIAYKFYCEDEDFFDEYVGDDFARDNSENTFLSLRSYGCDRL